jgi:hypothetical protein
MNYFFWLRRAPETIMSKGKRQFLVLTFYVGSGIRDGKMLGSGSGMEKCSGPGSGIKHPGSATFGPVKLSVLISLF